uniref:Uncharacterized protein n=1 Tax=Romanomermis culicivorax TaxID=13658 RepID=A0A915IYX0_ROMCU
MDPHMAKGQPQTLDQQFRDNPPLPENVKFKILSQTMDPDYLLFENLTSIHKEVLKELLASEAVSKKQFDEKACMGDYTILTISGLPDFFTLIGILR